MTDFEILGMKPGASNEEIKKAYFTLVRKHPPQTDPEGFKKIRGAYERLCNGPEEIDLDDYKYPLPSDGFAKYLESTIDLYRSLGYSEEALKQSKSALDCFPESIGFHFLCAVCALENENYGIAAKNAEWLLGKDPTNRYFLFIHAKACYLRGWKKKAASAFETAYNLNVRSFDFETDYASFLCDQEQYQEAASVLLSLLSRKHDLKIEHFRYTLNEMQTCLLKLRPSDTSSAKEQEAFLSTVQQTLAVISNYARQHREETSLMSELFIHGNQILNLLDDSQARKTEEAQFRSNFLSMGLKVMEREIFKTDVRFPENVRTAASYLLDVKMKGSIDFRAKDLLLCMMAELKEREKVLPLLDIISESYPTIASRIEPYAKRIREVEDMEIVKIDMAILYLKSEKEFQYKTYLDKYPQDAKLYRGIRVTTGASNANGEKRIPRNAPCPCGSGRKYKNCCLKRSVS